ncbi:hypothetical protein FOA43_000996 [Brettanomyces nanus]|uniref:DNA topoisomerase (ATP-hydrolyzing) n=1 Tax=Eeniella nana TaxID=13502 RepID=A0A875RYI2_EENNA|nr:uncharacterized protein FOA43_000996 [Brettanomyces nanus]QPG73683.1 hypothetical protein FOA43_000996 [Brettanomyces nanus]
MSVTFPSFDDKEALRFARYIKVMRILVDNLCSKTSITTKRQIYYSDVALFQNQRIVDEYVGNIVGCLGVNIESLGIMASQKGLVFGNLQFQYQGHKNINISEIDGATLIPLISLNSKSQDFKFSQEALFDEIIVVEKDSIFRSLCQALRGQRKLIVTAKGFPDRLTKVFVYFVCSHFSKVPVSCLVDSDVYGLLIYYEYKYSPAVQLSIGTGKRLKRETIAIRIGEHGETETIRYQSSCGRLKYEGVRLFDRQIANLTVNKVSVLFLPIKLRDFKCMIKFLGRIQARSYSIPGTDKESAKLVRELQLGMFFMVKKEMQEPE